MAVATIRRQTGGVSDRLTTDRLLPWVLRASWAAVLVAGGPALDAATTSTDPTVGDALGVIGLIAWTAGLIAMAIPAVASLTAVRMIVPAATFVAVACLGAGASVADGGPLLVTAILATAVAMSAELGRSYVQASAYGEEDRHLLRAPAAYAAAAVLTWSVWAAALTSTPVLFATGRWVLGVVAGLVTIAGGVLGWPRWHRLARRWFVVVPIGVVIHDHLVLAETVLIRRHEIARIQLAPADTRAADLTGPASGHAVEISTTEPVTVIFAATPKQPHGTAIHLTGALIAPSRPGRALAAAAARRLPVGVG